jgi:hypothetical protein
MERGPGALSPLEGERKAGCAPFQCPRPLLAMTTRKRVCISLHCPCHLRGAFALAPWGEGGAKRRVRGFAMQSAALAWISVALTLSRPLRGTLSLKGESKASVGASRKGAVWQKWMSMDCRVATLLTMTVTEQAPLFITLALGESCHGAKAPRNDDEVGCGCNDGDRASASSLLSPLLGEGRGEGDTAALPVRERRADGTR